MLNLQTDRDRGHAIAELRETAAALSLLTPKEHANEPFSIIRSSPIVTSKPDQCFTDYFSPSFPPAKIQFE